VRQGDAIATHEDTIAIASRVIAATAKDEAAELDPFDLQ